MYGSFNTFSIECVIKSVQLPVWIRERTVTKHWAEWYVFSVWWPSQIITLLVLVCARTRKIVSWLKPAPVQIQTEILSVHSDWLETTQLQDTFSSTAAFSKKKQQVFGLGIAFIVYLDVEGMVRAFGKTFTSPRRLTGARPGEGTYSWHWP